MDVLTLTLADDHPLFREGLAVLLREQTKVPLKILATVNDGIELMESLEEKQPDIILLDLNMPRRDGLNVLPEIRELYPAIKVIALTMYQDAKFIKEVIDLGGKGYLLKSSSLEDLLGAIREVQEGYVFIGNNLKVFPKEENDATNGQFHDDFQLKYNLTKREIEILILIAEANSNKKIGELLFISDQTVSVHRKNIMRKLSISNTAGLIKFAIDNGLI